MPNEPAQFFLGSYSLLSSGIFCIGVFFFLLLLSIWLVLSVWPLWLVIYVELVVSYDFTIYDIGLFLLLRSTGFSLRLFWTLLLQPCCQASPYCPSQLCADDCIIHWHMLLLSLWQLLLWWRASMPNEDNEIINPITHWAVTHICSMQELCLCCRPNSSITQGETTGHLPCSLVLITLHSLCLGLINWITTLVV